MIRVALIHPSRGRSHLAFNIYNEWVDMAKNPKEVEYIMVLDDDDPTLESYNAKFSAIDQNRVGRFVYCVGHNKNIVAAANKAATLLSDSTELIVAVADDMGSMKFWDESLFEVLKNVDNFNQPRYIGISDGIHPFGPMLNFNVNRAWYNKVGHVVYPGYDGVYGDNDYVQTAYTLKSVIQAPHILFEHRHPSAGKVPWDETYTRHNNKEGYERNAKIYEERAKRNFDIPIEVGAVRQMLYLSNAEYIKGMTSIIIVTHNRLDYTKKCFNSIRKHTPEPHEIIFVDNGSTDGTVKWLRSQMNANKNCRIFENKETVKLSVARNLGINMSQGEFIAHLDSDVIVSEGWLESMLQVLDSSTDTGIIGPMTNNISGLQHVINNSYLSGDYLDKYAAGFHEQYRHRRIPCTNVSGFCMLLRRTLAEKIGLFDQRFDTGDFEDEDYSIRVSLAGYTNYIADDVFMHRQGGKRTPGDRKTIEKKWTLSLSTPEGKKLAVLKAMELANQTYSKGQTDQAVEILISCIKFTPDARQIYYDLTRIFLESKSFAQAWEVIGTMPDAAKNDIKGLEYSGYTKEGLGMDDEAAAYAHKILELNSRSAAAMNLLGILAYKSGEKEKAADCFLKAIENDPGYGETYTNLGVLYWGMDKQTEALNNLQKGFVLSPNVPDVCSLYYSVVSSLGEYAAAEADFLEASQLYPHNKKLVFLSIDILLQQGKLEAAIRKIEDALAVFGLDEGTMNAALAVREKLGSQQIDKTASKSTVSLCMIVKNEEQNMVKCLKSVRDIADEIIIVDTGSTDKTKDIARVFGAKLFDFPWTGDFAAARNYSLAQAKGHWLLILDADEVISSKDFKEFKKIIHKKSSAPAAYTIVTRNYITTVSIIGWTQNTGEYIEEAGTGWVTSAKVRLFTRSKDAFFSNPVHEIVEDSLNKAKIPIYPSDIVVHHYGKLDAQKDQQKGADYYLLGKIKYESDPTNVKYIMELAKQSQVLHKFEEAVELWLKLLSIFYNNTDSPDYREIAKISYGDPIAEIYTQLAHAYLMLDRFDEGLVAARKAMQSKIKLKEYIHVYAHCEIIAGLLNNAFCALEEVLKTTPDYPPAVLLKAIIFCLEGKKEKAAESFQSLRNTTIQLTPLLNRYAQQFQIYGKRAEALLLLNAMVENKLNDGLTMRLIEENKQEKQ
jgi:glycosyltransferase involved in cell wall biosynthesis